MDSSHPGKGSSFERPESTGLISIGALETKVPAALNSLLSSLDVPPVMSKNYAYPGTLSSEITCEIQGFLQEKNIHSAVFDIRIPYWTNKSRFNRDRNLAKKLLSACESLSVNNSFILTNGGKFLGNALGYLAESFEIRNTLKGEGPPDLTKYILEIGADLLMMTGKAGHRREAKMYLRDRILSGAFSSYSPDSPERWDVLAWEKGYVHHLSIGEIHQLKEYLADTHPEISLFLKKKERDPVEIDDVLIEFYSPRGQKTLIDEQIYRKVFVFSPHPPKHQPMVLERWGLNLHCR
jgi:thymidine phosphorylase